MTDFNIDKTYALAANEGSSVRTGNKYIVLHETTNVGAWNNASFEKRTWRSNSAYVHYIIGDGGKIYQVGEEGYVAWGAGSYANSNSPVQIELARTNDRATFDKDYRTYVEFARAKAKQFGIPCVLDGSGNGIKTHYWITNNLWGDHVDPVKSYLEPNWGITQSKLANDIANGFSTEKPVEVPVKSVARNVVTIDNGPDSGIAGWNSKGEIIKGSNTDLRNRTSWITDGIKVINGLPMFKVATDEYIPKKYTNQSNIITINSIHGVDAFHADGTKYEGTTATFKDLSTWQSPDNGIKMINGRLHFQVSTDQYIDAFYTIGGGNK